MLAGAPGGGQAPPLAGAPAGTLIARNVFAELGVFVKQAGAVYAALAASTTIANNTAFNLPRAAGAWRARTDRCCLRG